MNIEAMPIVRMEIEGMKAAILTHLGARGSELGEALSVQVDKAIANYDWEGKVKRLVEDCISEKIASYFKYGQGARAITDAIDEGFASVLNKAATHEPE